MSDWLRAKRQEGDSQNDKHCFLQNIGRTLTETYYISVVNPLAPKDLYMCRTAQLTSRRCILNIYSADILTEYFKHAAHFPFFFLSLQDAVYFIMLSFSVPVIFTF